MAPFTYLALVLALVGSALAAPAPVGPEILEKRITHSGRGTFFNVGLGACGKFNVDSDHIVAIPSSRFNGGGNCEQFVEIVNKKNGKHAFGLVRDSCPGCGSSDLDLSPSLFQALGASLDEGVISIDWHFKQKGFKP
ncbi:RlpA-like double-psi beta-barrel-protein domain-containing protein-containing protein [Cerioporus squamosus]|nr:RlpA-like double-psi beta-barrel-protein domain-containing protein-containing protein [Cerioporus squamosus]